MKLELAASVGGGEEQAERRRRGIGELRPRPVGQRGRQEFGEGADQVEGKDDGAGEDRDLVADELLPDEASTGRRRRSTSILRPLFSGLSAGAVSTSPSMKVCAVIT